MQENKIHACSFCGTEQSSITPLIAGLDGHICENCVQLANQVVTSWGRKRALAKPFSKPPIPKEIKSKLDDYIIGQESAKETLAVAVYNHYKRLTMVSKQANVEMANSDIEIEKSNILLLGPTGSGKTLLAKNLARIIGVPFVIADATTLTQAGYVGEDVETILHHLVDEADGNIDLAEWGIVYIDEIDKLAHSSESSHGHRDVSGEGVQQALLKLVEDSQIKLPDKSRGKEGKGDKMISTTNILFIAGGAFSGIEKVIQNRISPKKTAIGFHAAHADEAEEIKDVYSEAHADDLRYFGLIPEFIGRFPIVAGLEELDIDSLVKILSEPKNALIKQYTHLFEFDGVELEFEQDALTAIAEIALERGNGARGLRSVLEKILHKIMYTVPSEKNAVRCVVTREAVMVEAEVLIQYKDENQLADASNGRATAS